MEETKSNPRAASVRVLSKKASAYKGQRVHDLRHGKQPDYVNGDLTHLNRTLIAPPTPAALTKICAGRRNSRETKRAMKSGTNIAFVGIITFGAEAQALFLKLDEKAQDAAYLEVAQAVADRLNTTLEGLVVHNDESAPHAHMTFPAYDLDGQPLTKSVKRSALLKIQDDIAEIMGRHAPGIERGRSRRARIEAGASVAETINKSVRELHADLPADLETKRRELAEASARVDEMRGRVEGLEAKAELTDKEAKRLETYRQRLADRIEAEESAKAEAERLTALEVLRAEEARTIAAQAEEDARRISEKTGALLTASAAMVAELNAGTLRRTETGKVMAQNPSAMRPGLPDLNAFLQSGADAGEARHRAEAEAQRKREKADADLRSAKTILDDLKAYYQAIRSTFPKIRAVLTREDSTPAERKKAKSDRREVVNIAPSVRKIVEDAEKRFESASATKQSVPEAPDASDDLTM